LLTTTAGRLLVASGPSAGSSLTITMSPRRTLGLQAVASYGLPGRSVSVIGPGGERIFIGIAEFACAKQPDGPVHYRRPGFDALGLCVRIEECDVFLRQADTDLHTTRIPLVLPG
jgi:hypothetical protein